MSCAQSIDQYRTGTSGGGLYAYYQFGRVSKDGIYNRHEVWIQGGENEDFRGTEPVSRGDALCPVVEYPRIGDEFLRERMSGPE